MGPDTPSRVISADIESDHRVVGLLQVLSVGVVDVDDPSSEFYVEIQAKIPDYLGSEDNLGALEVCYPAFSWASSDPITADPRTEAWCKQFYERHNDHALPSDVATTLLRQWTRDTTPRGTQPVLVAGPASFDIAPILELFAVNEVRNPFSFSGICLKTVLWTALGMGSWQKQRTHNLPASLTEGLINPNPHNAHADAVYQAELYRRAIRILNG